jgi:hypothetical protein
MTLDKYKNRRKIKMKYKMCQIILFVAAVAMALPISVGVASAESVTIGIPLPLSGNLKAFGTMMKNSFEMAQASINETGGINGRPVNIVFADDEGQVASVKPAFDKLVAAKPVTRPTRWRDWRKTRIYLFSSARLRPIKSLRKDGRTSTA